ncbi:PLP-dependent aminotransferase family protein [Arcanobacterium hippocoleae]
MRAELSLKIERRAPSPLPAQIAAQIRALINGGTLKPGDALPGTRTLAVQLGVSRGTVTAAFDQLHAEGYLQLTPGGATKVHAALVQSLPAACKPAPSRAEIPRTLAPSPRKKISLKPSSASEVNVRASAWRSAWRQAAADGETHLAPAGQPELREAIAEHIRLTRMLPVAAESVLVTGGSREGLMLILMSFRRILRVGVEDPGHPGLRAIVTLLGHELLRCPVDKNGVIIAQLPEMDVLLVTPSYLYPSGENMPAARRSELISWASETNTVLIEDDFNTELRYGIAPMPTLHEGAIVLGTFSTLLHSSLSAGYVVAPPRFIETLLKTRAQLGMPVAGVTQRAIAYLLHNGYVRKHTRTMRATLERRKTIVAQELGAWVRPMGFDFFLHFPQEKYGRGEQGRDERQEEAAQTRLLSRFEQIVSRSGIDLVRADQRWAGGAQGFILSFGHLSDAQFDFVLRVIASALRLCSAHSDPRR